MIKIWGKLIKETEQINDSINEIKKICAFIKDIQKEIGKGIVLKEFHFTGDSKIFDSNQYI
mgnify:CR=1 FL=1